MQDAFCKEGVSREFVRASLCEARGVSRSGLKGLSELGRMDEGLSEKIP